MFMCEQSGKKTVWKQLRQNQISPETEKTNVFMQLSEETNWRGNVFTINYFFQLWAKKKRTGEQYVYAWNWGETIILFILYSKYKKWKVLICKKKSEQQNVVSKKKRTCENWWEKHLRRKFVLFHTWKREKSWGGKRRESVKAKRIFSRRKQTCELRKNVLRKRKSEKKIHDKKVILFKCVKTEWK